MPREVKKKRACSDDSGCGRRGEEGKKRQERTRVKKKVGEEWKGGGGIKSVKSPGTSIIHRQGVCLDEEVT